MARAWAHGSGPAAPDHVLEDMKILGAPQQAIDEWRAQLKQQEEEDVIELPADCRAAVRAFFAVDTQWNNLVVGDRLLATGLNYVGVRAALRFLRMPVSAALFADLQLMESAALAAMAERR